MIVCVPMVYPHGIQWFEKPAVRDILQGKVLYQNFDFYGKLKIIQINNILCKLFDQKNTINFKYFIKQ